MRGKNGKLLRKLERGGWVKKVEWENKKLVFVDWFLHYIYYMALFGGDKEDYKKWRNRESRLKNYYLEKGAKLPEGYILSLDSAFQGDPKSLGRREEKILVEALSNLNNRNTRAFLRSARNRVLLYRVLYRLALGILNRVVAGGLISRIKRKIRSLLGGKEAEERERKRERWQVVIEKKDGFSPPQYILRVETPQKAYRP